MCQDLNLWSRYKLNLLYHHFYETHGNQTYKTVISGWEVTTRKVTGHFNEVITLQYKNVLPRFSRDLWSPNLLEWWLKETGHHSISCVTDWKGVHVKKLFFANILKVRKISSFPHDLLTTKLVRVTTSGERATLTNKKMLHIQLGLLSLNLQRS